MTEYDAKTIIYVVKEVMKLPLDKETQTIKYEDVIKLIHNLLENIQEEEVKEILKELEE